MNLKNKFVAVLMIFIFAALVPLIYLSNEYGFSNIPHYDLTMWIFLELYALICMVVFAVILLIVGADGEDEPPKKRKRSSAAQKKKPGKKSLTAQREDKKKENKRKPRKKKDKTVESPEIWEEREFQ